MATTLSDLKSALRTELRIDPNDKIWPEATKEKYLNAAYRRIQRDGQYNWRENQVEYDATLTAGTEKYNLATIFGTDDFVRLDFIQLKDSLTNLRCSDLATVRTRGTTGQGMPNEYFIYGNYIGLYPVPDSAYTLLVLYRKRLPTMTSAVDMALPDDFADAIVKYAAYLAWSSPRGDRMSAQEKMADYQELLSELKITYLMQDTKQLKFGYQRSIVNNRSDKALYYD